ncbi:hypothetical protein OIU74_026182 [Salix koriyanagi]|uniref:Uncharacterized protein n=1 Tax=Salix koriyanagi TaxID=2511006 RepID=A0A9Q1A3T3_9ROSI|nr:hypothetical protein OIU74_026182 [Salix koriyanagi]
MGAAGTIVRCTSTEPADTDNPMTAHAPPRTRNNNPDERTTAARASGNTRARSCPHRWTRRISEGQETNRRGTRQGQSLRGRLPKLGSRRPGLGSRRVTP